MSPRATLQRASGSDTLSLVLGSPKAMSSVTTAGKHKVLRAKASITVWVGSAWTIVGGEGTQRVTGWIVASGWKAIKFAIVSLDLLLLAIHMGNVRADGAMHINLAWDRKSMWGLDGMTTPQNDARKAWYWGSSDYNPVSEILQSLRTERASCLG